MLKIRNFVLILLFLVSTAFAGQPDSSKKTVVPEENPWVIALSIPGWIAGVSGDVGVGKFVSYANTSPSKVIRSMDMGVLLRGEASKGRFGLMSDFIYLSLSDGVGTNTVVNKIDLRVDETLGQLAARWRILEGPRGSLDIYGGARYLNIYQAVTLQPNTERINERSAELVNAVSERLGQGIEASINKILGPQLNPLLGRHPNPTLPVAPLFGFLRDEIKDRVGKIIEGRKDELIAAIREMDAAATAALRAQARDKVTEIKNDLTRRIARTLQSKIDRSAALTAWWLDPFIGLRGRWNLNHAWYLTARGDVGGFGVGSKFAWEAEGALGCQLTRSIFAEAGYRALGMNFQDDGIVINTITRGAQISLGVIF